MKCWLTKKTWKGTNIWEFELVDSVFSHQTRYGTWYDIDYKNLEISIHRIIVCYASDRRVENVTRKLRCVRLEFEDGGRYEFPKRKSG